jgi:hypothetical protein
VRAIDLRLALGGDAVDPRHVGQPHQQQGCVADELLLAGEFGQARLALRFLHRNNAPELEVRRCRGGLRRGDQQFERSLGQRLRQEATHRAVVEDGFQHGVPLCGCSQRAIAVALPQ